MPVHVVYSTQSVFLLIPQITAANPPTVLVGARLPRSYRFTGTIYNVVIFSSLVNSNFVTQLMTDYRGDALTTGECVNYLARNAACPPPTQAPSLYCATRAQT